MKHCKNILLVTNIKQVLFDYILPIYCVILYNTEGGVSPDRNMSDYCLYYLYVFHVVLLVALTDELYKIGI